MVVNPGEKAGLLIFGFIFAWAAMFSMLSNFFEIFTKETIGWWAFWVLFAICVLISSIFLGIGFGAEIVDSKAS